MDGWMRRFPRPPIPEGSLSHHPDSLGCGFWWLLLPLLTKTAWLDLTWAHTSGKVAKRFQIWLGCAAARNCGLVWKYPLPGEKVGPWQLCSRKGSRSRSVLHNRLELNLTWAMNHAVRLPFNHITEPTTFVSATIYTDTKTCIYTDRGMGTTEAFWLIVSLGSKTSFVTLPFSRSWFKDVEMEGFERPGVEGVGDHWFTQQTPPGTHFGTSPWE